MRDLLLLAIHLLVTIAKLLRPGGARAVAAESLLLKQQIIVSNRSRRRAPNLTTLDRFVLGLITLFVSPHRIPRLSAIIKSGTLYPERNLVAYLRRPCPSSISADELVLIVREWIYEHRYLIPSERAYSRYCSAHRQ